MKIGEAFRHVGTFSIFQKLTMVILAFGGGFHGMQSSSNNFIWGPHEHWCNIKKLQNFSFEQQKYIAIPENSDGEYESCYAFNVSWENYDVEDFLKWNRSTIAESIDRVSCDDYVYSKEVFLETANSKWDLVCSNSILGEMMSTVYVIGLFLGSVISGRISDSLGRRTAEFGFCILLMVTLYAAAFVPNPIAFLVLRFMVGFSMRGAHMCSSVLMMELSGKNSREFAGVLVPGFFAIGVMICSGCAFFLRDFQLLHIVMGGIATCILLTILVILPESPRWLLVHGKVDKAEKTVKWIGQVNKNPLPDDFTLEQEKTAEHNTKDNLSYFDLYRHPVLRKHIIIMHFLWIACNFSHMSMTLNLGALTGNAYLNVFLSGATELPACVIIFFVMRKMGRNKTFYVFGFVFVLCNATAIPFELMPDLRIGASIATILARAAASALICDIRILTAELFPTPLRQRVLGAVTGLSAAVGISGPYVGGSLRDVWRPLPNLIFGSLGVAAVILITFLPDTRGHPLPETMEDAIAIGNKEPRKHTMETVSSVSVSMEKLKENGLNGAPNYFITKDIPNDQNSMDDNILVFHF